MVRLRSVLVIHPGFRRVPGHQKPCLQHMGLTMTKRDMQAREYAAESYGKTYPKRCVSHTDGAAFDLITDANDFLLDMATRRFARTHYEGCRRDHVECLVAALVNEIERLREGRELDGQSIGVLVGECQDLHDRCINGEPTEAWIPVTEQLPPEPGRYVARPDGAMWYFCDFDGEFLVEKGAAPITHWMPDTPLSLDMRLEALPDRLAQEVRKELKQTRWRTRIQKNIIARLMAALGNRGTNQ